MTGQNPTGGRKSTWDPDRSELHLRHARFLVGPSRINPAQFCNRHTMRADSALPFAAISFAFAACLLLPACSDMKFVNAQPGEEAEEGQEDVRLTGVVVDITSGTQLTNRIRSTRANMSDVKNLLEFQDVKVESYKDAKLDGVTA